MIGHLTGKVIAKSGRELIVDVSGVGYQVFLSSRSSASVDEEIAVFIRTVVREDEFSLYGFETLVDRQLFDSLCDVNGIGPKLAMTIIDELGYEVATAAISGGDERVLQSVTGVGAKTAKLMILSLGGKFESPAKAADTSLVDALMSLGWKEREAIEALNSVSKTGGSQQELLKAALKYLGASKK
jgi:Holliday junction DNA helicase RuvA